MKRLGMAATILSAIALSGPFAAEANVLSFNGSITGLGITGPDAGCAPYPFRGTITGATGSSSLGTVTYGHDICLDGAPGTSAGTFNIEFGSGSIFGTMTGTAEPSGIPLISNIFFNYVINGGMGDFLGASGTFTGAGTADNNFHPTHVAIAFDGLINAPAVPEPGSWSMMLLGFGGLGFALRRRRLIEHQSQRA